MIIFIGVSPYVRDRIVGFCAWIMAMVSDVASRKKVSLLTCGNGTCCGKNSTVSASRSAPVFGMKHLKLR